MVLPGIIFFANKSYKSPLTSSTLMSLGFISTKGFKGKAIFAFKLTFPKRRSGLIFVEANSRRGFLFNSFKTLLIDPFALTENLPVAGFFVVSATDNVEPERFIGFSLVG